LRLTNAKPHFYPLEGVHRFSHFRILWAAHFKISCPINVQMRKSNSRTTAKNKHFCAEKISKYKDKITEDIDSVATTFVGKSCNIRLEKHDSIALIRGRVAHWKLTTLGASFSFLGLSARILRLILSSDLMLGIVIG
jgi:hypothetical protein